MGRNVTIWGILVGLFVLSSGTFCRSGELTDSDFNFGIALLESKYTQSFYERQDMNYNLSFAKVKRLLIQLNIPFQTISDQKIEAGNLQEKGIKVLVLTNAECMSPKEVKEVKKFVRDGGKLLATYLDSMRDEKGNMLNNFQLNEEIGVNFVKIGNLSDGFLRLSPSLKDYGIPFSPEWLTVRYYTPAIVEQKEGTSVVGRWFGFDKNTPYNEGRNEAMFISKSGVYFNHWVLNTEYILLDALHDTREFLGRVIVGLLPNPKNANIFSRHRAVWIWNYKIATELSSKHQEEVFRKCSEDGIDRIFLYIDISLIRQYKDGYRKFIANAHQRKVKVDALAMSGNPIWYKDGGGLKIVDAVIEYNSTVSPEEQFDGFSMDAEGPTAPEWLLLSSREDILQFTLQLHKECSERWHTSFPTLPFSAAIHTWFDVAEKAPAVKFQGKLKPASQHFIDILDETILMDYRDRALGPDGIIINALDEMEYARKVKKKVIIGLEHDQLPPFADPGDISFFEEGWDVREQAVKLVTFAFGDYESFGGFAFHSSSSLFDPFLKRIE